MGRKALGIAVVAAGLALVGCRPAADPAARDGLDGNAWNDSQAAELSAAADVAFTGRVRSVCTARPRRLLDRPGFVLDVPADTVLVAEPRLSWLVTVDVRRVAKGDAAAWSGERHLAIHSPVRTFGASAVEAVGRTYTFFLSPVAGDTEGRWLLEVLPGG